jgi:1,4-alpha-glucan branching enzyme
MSEDDLFLFREGTHCGLHEKLGAQRATVDGVEGTVFTVWAPNARSVAVIGSFNDWDPQRHPLQPVGDGGQWSGFVGAAAHGALYKYRVESRSGRWVNKTDPFGFYHQTSPETASIVWNLDYRWQDDDWMATRADHTGADVPMSIYELHLGSWRRDEDDTSRLRGYRELADELIPYLERMRFTHVELLPPMEHPFYGSWGYQTTGYFAPTSRYGSPQDLMHLIDRLHGHGIGVILDWVPSHFPADEHGLANFDGTHLFEYADPRLGYHPDWNSLIFDYGRNEVRSFLVSSAIFWIERYHVDAIRVDAVASMLYLDYSREDGQWVPNKYGGRENLEAIEFPRSLNVAIHERFPEVPTIAEESTSWPMVSRAVHLGGLGFDMKWDMGWMHDTLRYMALDPIHRKYHHDSITFRMLYAFSENFVLPLSHDEVVHGKSSLLAKMSGDYWQKFANLRSLYGYMYAQPGKKLLFMGGELGQWSEWDHERGLEWQLLDYPQHAGLQAWLADLNGLYRAEPALHELDFDPAGFRWTDCGDADQSVLCFLRLPRPREEEEEDAVGRAVLVVCNFTPLPRHNYRVGVPLGGTWREILNSDDESYGGSGVGDRGELRAVPMTYHGLPYSLCLTLPPLAVVFFKREGASGETGAE